MKHINRLRINCFQFLGVVLFLVPIVCTAEIVLVGPHQISVPVPMGHCVLQETNFNHNRLIQMQKDAQRGMNEVLLSSVDCGQLTDWESRHKLSLDDFGLVLAAFSHVDKKVPMTNDQYISGMRKVFVAQSYKEIDKWVTNAHERMNSVLEEGFGASRVNESKILGILSQDENALYLGISSLLTTETGKSKKQVAIVAMLLVDGKAISLNLYTKYRGTSTIHDLLSSIQRWADRVQRNN